MTGLLIDEVAQYLAAQGMGTYDNSGSGNIFIGDLPTSPDVALAVLQTSGLAQDIQIPIFYPSFQILLRDTEIDTGLARTQTVRNILGNLYNAQLITNGTYIYACNLSGHGGHIGRDDNGRDLFSLNFQCRVR